MEEDTKSVKGQLLTVCPSLEHLPSLDPLLAIWHGVRKRMFMHYQLSARAYFHFLKLSGNIYPFSCSLFISFHVHTCILIFQFLSVSLIVFHHLSLHVHVYTCVCVLYLFTTLSLTPFLLLSLPFPLALPFSLPFFSLSFLLSLYHTAGEQAGTSPGLDDMNVTASLRLLRLLVKYAGELKTELETGFIATPTKPWKGMISLIYA